MSLQRRSFDPSLNPFLRTANPFRIQQKFHTQPSSQQKSKKGFFTKHFYDSKCDHCVKNVPLLEEMNVRSTFLKAQKQNLQKIPSTKFKSGKIGSNPFEKSRLMGENMNGINRTQNEYNRHDEGKLRSLLQNNPFKKYTQQKKSIEKNEELDVEFRKINLIRFKQRQSFDVQNKENLSRLVSPINERKSSARFSIDSMNNLSNRMKSNENSPHKKSKFSPTIGDIMSYRESSSKKSINQGSSNENNQNKMSCLILQISKSRKDLLQYKKPQAQRQNQSYPMNQSKLPPKSPQKQVKHSNLQDPEVITIRGKKFFLHQVKYRH